jgi:hypothetical protein
LLIDCNKAFRRKLQDKKRDRRFLEHLMRPVTAGIEGNRGNCCLHRYCMNSKLGIGNGEPKGKASKYN